MTSLTPWDQLSRSFIGFDQLRQFAESNATSNYPVHNIEELSPDNYRLTVAVAGFARDDLQVSLQNGFLTVSGKTPESDKSRKFLYRGLAQRNFTQNFRLGDNVIVTNAGLENGILTIDLQREVPEAQKPRLISIS